jgi:hypothetical protein
MSDAAWHRWRILYATRRRNTSFEILEARGKHIAITLMKNITVISNARDCTIEVTHRDSDPGTWVVRQFEKLIWFRKRISSDWFTDRQQALAFAEEMKRKHAVSEQGAGTKENIGNAE